MSGLLFTGDLQAEWENLDLCKEVISQMLEWGKSHQADGIVILGDLKERYNPIDGRVLNFIISMIHRFKRIGMEVFILLGNHDRFSLHSDEESWLKALGKAGAHVYDKEAVVEVKGFHLYMLPFRSSGTDLRRMACRLRDRKLSADGNHCHGCHILCFHAQLKESNIPVEGPGTIAVDKLYPKMYDYVFGGHLHRRQTVKYNHVMYVGSPFANSWSDVNQKKGFVFVDTSE